MKDRRPGEDLLADIRAILGRDITSVVDVGAHRGGTLQRYLAAFPQMRGLGIEAEADNFAALEEALGVDGRVDLMHAAVAEDAGEIVLHVNSHDGTHSVHAIGEQRYWAGYAEAVREERVRAVRLDDVVDEAKGLDLLHMDIQGGELAALRGAERLLAGGKLSFVYTEVEFFPLYVGQPLFWDVGAFLLARGYHLYSLYDRYYHRSNPGVLSWADALFIHKDLLVLPENRPDQDGSA